MTLGRSRPAVSNLLRLLELPEPVQELVEQGALSEGHARAVLMADGARARREVAERVVAEGLSVRQTEELARGGGRPPARPGRLAVEPSSVAERAVDVLYGVFEAPVRVRNAAGGAVFVQLRFASEDALRDALDRLD